MANRTLKDAHSVRGTNPQYLVEKIIQTLIYESKYWKEECFGLMAELVVDKALELCLWVACFRFNPRKSVLKMKYVRVLGALYMRLTGTAINYEFIDELVHSERVCDIILPQLQKQEAEQLEPRVSALEEDIDDVESSEEEEEEDKKSERVPSSDHRRRSYGDLVKPRPSPTLRYRRSRSRSPRRRNRSPKRRSPFSRRERHPSKSPRRHCSRSRDRQHRSRPKSPGPHRSHRYRSHSKSPKRSKKSHKKSSRGNEYWTRFGFSPQGLLWV
uniref:Pre-mRNA-splicing factor 38B n=1 Tax=Nomascus leucogenys TaxID=61853 RepID=A0A2I3GA77_NOMLE